MRAAHANRTDEALIAVSRDYWVGVKASRSLTVRAGRMNLPFGIRSDQHILYTRAVTRTSTNADQQLGVAAAYEARSWRGEIMAVAGNLQVSPDAFRERGYAGYAAWSPSNQLEIGASSMVLGAGADIATLVPTVRQAHGVFTRWAPTAGIAVLGEADVLLTSEDLGGAARELSTGLALDLHADFEATKGVHLKAGAEVCNPAFSSAETAGRGWGAVQWFFAPHVNLRIDALYGPLTCTAGAESRPMALAQLHAFL